MIVLSGDVGIARTTQSQPHPHELELAEDVTHSPTPHSRCTAATIAPSPASATCRCPHSREPAGRPLHSLEQACWQRRHAHACTTLSPTQHHLRQPLHHANARTHASQPAGSSTNSSLWSCLPAGSHECGRLRGAEAGVGGVV